MPVGTRLDMRYLPCPIARWARSKRPGQHGRGRAPGAETEVCPKMRRMYRESPDSRVPRGRPGPGRTHGRFGACSGDGKGVCPPARLASRGVLAAVKSIPGGTANGAGALAMGAFRRCVVLPPVHQPEQHLVHRFRDLRDGETYSGCGGLADGGSILRGPADGARGGGISHSAPPTGAHLLRTMHRSHWA